MGSEPDLRTYARSAGIETEWFEAGGIRRRASDETLRRLLTGLRLPDTPTPISPAATGQPPEPGRRLCEPVVVLTERAGRSEVPVRLPERAVQVKWRLTTEEGMWSEGTAGLSDLVVGPAGEHAHGDSHGATHRLRLPGELPRGYHRLDLEAAGHRAGCRLIMAPPRAWQPVWMLQKEQLWGLTAPLYALRSQPDDGMGDFGKLARLVDGAADLGADLVALSPVHALFAACPQHDSPYAPSSRRWLDERLIDVRAAARLLGQADPLPAPGPSAGARTDLRVDPLHTLPRREQALDRLFAGFRSGQRDGHGPGALRQQFEQFITMGGDDLFAYALFQALHRYFKGTPWFRWPDGFRSPGDGLARRWGARHREKIRYHAFLQWLAAHQLEQVGRGAAERMKVGVAADLAVGVPETGFDVWAEESLFARGVEIGAPPDAFNASGQSWGLVPWSPQALREAGYRPWIEVLRAAMRLGGGIRIDHAMALERLFWIPEGAPPRQGAYVRYPIEEMLGILALESHRNHSLVMAEDLGTVPEGFRGRLRNRGLLSTRLVHFERDSEEGYRRASSYPYESVSAVSTHDLPPLRAWLSGHDLAVRTGLGLIDRDTEQQELLRRRSLDRDRLIDRLKQERLLPEAFHWPPPMDDVPPEALLRRVIIALCGFLGHTGSALRLVSLEDLAFSREQLNLPGMTGTYPNWRVRVSLPVEMIADDTFVQRCAEAVTPTGSCQER